MPAIVRGKALVIELAAMVGWVTLPVLSGMFPVQLRTDVFHRTNPLVNLNHGIGFLGLMLPVLFVIWASGDGWKEFGIRRIRWGVDALWCLGFFAVGTLLYIPFKPEAPTAHVHPQGVPVALSILFLAAIAATFEELVFRGYLISRLEEVTGKTWVGVTVASVLFAIGHFYQGPAGAMGALIFGLLASGAYVARRSIWPLTVAHMAVNIAITYTV
jgi:membrane protease YdiL (CAAX protease family)